MYTVFVASLCVRRHSSAHAFAITASITTASIMVTCLVVRLRVHCIVTRSEHVVVDNAAFDLRPDGSGFVEGARVDVFGCRSARCAHFPRIAECSGVRRDVVRRCQKIVGLVAIEITAETTRFS